MNFISIGLAPVYIRVRIRSVKLIPIVRFEDYEKPNA